MCSALRFLCQIYIQKAIPKQKQVQLARFGTEPPGRLRLCRSPKMHSHTPRSSCGGVANILCSAVLSFCGPCRKMKKQNTCRAVPWTSLITLTPPVYSQTHSLKQYFDHVSKMYYHAEGVWVTYDTKFHLWESYGLVFEQRGASIVHVLCMLNSSLACCAG